jgi:hypothetical protein
VIVHHGSLDSGIAYLQKPIVPELLARRVPEVLGSPKRGWPRNDVCGCPTLGVC